jgi:hypothetical protein
MSLTAEWGTARVLANGAQGELNIQVSVSGVPAESDERVALSDVLKELVDGSGLIAEVGLYGALLALRVREGSDEQAIRVAVADALGRYESGAQERKTAAEAAEVQAAAEQQRADEQAAELQARLRGE